MLNSANKASILSIPESAIGVPMDHSRSLLIPIYSPAGVLQMQWTNGMSAFVGIHLPSVSITNFQETDPSRALQVLQQRLPAMSKLYELAMVMAGYITNGALTENEFIRKTYESGNMPGFNGKVLPRLATQFSSHKEKDSQRPGKYTYYGSEIPANFNNTVNHYSINADFVETGLSIPNPNSQIYPQLRANLRLPAMQKQQLSNWDRGNFERNLLEIGSVIRIHAAGEIPGVSLPMQRYT